MQTELLLPNIALEGNATQSSSYKHVRQHDRDYAKYAIDGDFSTNLRQTGRCAHTKGDAGAWWQVEFTDVYRIQKVAITTRKRSGDVT